MLMTLILPSERGFIRSAANDECCRALTLGVTHHDFLHGERIESSRYPLGNVRLRLIPSA